MVRSIVASSRKPCAPRQTNSICSAPAPITTSARRQSLAFVCVGGPPHISDLDRGKRTGTLEDTRNIIKLNQHFDVIHIQSPNVEAQDVDCRSATTHHRAPADALRQAAVRLSRGTPQVLDSFEMVRLARGLSEAEFTPAILLHRHQHQFAAPARHPDVPGHHRFRARRPGVGHHAFHPCRRHGAGHHSGRAHASACRSLGRHHLAPDGAARRAGGVRLVHVERRHEVGGARFRHAGIRQGAFGAGQLARHIGLPWRGSAATASNAPDEQAVYEY